MSELVCILERVLCVSQGVVCTLHEGDDFGKLALVTDSPRAASIVLREDNCHFLRVDKEDFNRILRVGEQEMVIYPLMGYKCSHTAAKLLPLVQSVKILLLAMFIKSLLSLTLVKEH